MEYGGRLTQFTERGHEGVIESVCSSMDTLTPHLLI